MLKEAVLSPVAPCLPTALDVLKEWAQCGYLLHQRSKGALDWHGQVLAQISCYNRSRVPPLRGVSYIYSHEWERFCLPWNRYAEANLTRMLHVDQPCRDYGCGLQANVRLTALHRQLGTVAYTFSTQAKEHFVGWHDCCESAAAAELYRREQSLPALPRAASVVVDVGDSRLGILERIWSEEEQHRAWDFMERLTRCWQLAHQFVPTPPRDTAQ